MTTGSRATPGSQKIELDEQGLPRGYRLRDQWEVTPRQVKAMLDAGDDFVLLDCRTDGEHQVARIEGGLRIPLQELGARLAELGRYADRKVVVFCHHGSRSLRMSQILRQDGFKDVKSMAGGIDLWSIDVDHGVPRY